MEESIAWDVCRRGLLRTGHRLAYLELVIQLFKALGQYMVMGMCNLGVFSLSRSCTLDCQPCRLLGTSPLSYE